MIGYLIKNWRLLLDIIVVVGGIIAFTLFDPFGMFSKRELKGTANLVSSIKDIGELVTAEYYGEVISSLNETFIFDIPEEEVDVMFEDCLFTLKEECKNAIYNKKNVRQFIKSRELESIRTEFNGTDDFIYNHLIVMMAAKLSNSDIDKHFKENEKLKKKTELIVLKEIYNRIENINKEYKKKKKNEEEENAEEEKNKELNAYIYKFPDYLENKVELHYQLNEKSMSKKELRHDIVFIGRGWVKAGYKFEKLDERNFAYDKDIKLIRFYGLSPVILDKDINPWFVPEKKIKGFELVDFYKKATFEEAKIVKKRCKEKLLEQANHSGIMNQAQINGEEALKNFFSLLLDEPDLKVEFHPLPFQNELNLIVADTLITVEEALLVDSIFNRFEHKIKKESRSSMRRFQKQQLQIFYNQLKEVHFIDSTSRFNMFSIEAARILENKYFIVRADYNNFKSLRGTLDFSDELGTIFTSFTKKSQIPFRYPEFITQFNQTMVLIDKQLKLAIADTLITVEITKQKLDLLNMRMDCLDGINAEPSDKLMKGNPIYVLTRESLTLPYNFTDLMYPELDIDDSFKDMFSISNLDSIGPSLDSIIEKSRTDTENPKMDSIRDYELDSILKPYEQSRIKREITLKPIHKFIDLVKKPLN